MAEITAQDKSNLTKLKIFAGPELAAFAEKMMLKKGQSPALDAAGDAFAAHAGDWKNMGKLKALNEQFKKNPQLERQMEELLRTNPQGFTDNVGRMFENPDQTLTIVNEQIAKGPQPASVAANTPPQQSQRPAPSAVTKTEPAAIPAAGANPTPGPAERSEAVAKKVLSEEPSLEQKLADLQAAPGFDGLMERVSANPHLQDMFHGMTSGDPKESADMINTIHDQLKADPEFFNKVNKTIDKTPPGVMSTFASLIANDSKSGFATFGFYNNMQNGSMGSFLEKIMQNEHGVSMISNILPMIAKVMQFFSGAMGHIKGFVPDALKASDNVMAQESRPGVTARALEAAKANPKVAMVDKDSGDIATHADAGALRQAQAQQGTPPEPRKPQPGSSEPAFSGA